jgi:hypothetical protein
MPDNTQFLQAIFKDDASFAHITDFPYDPSAIPSDRHLSAWKGDWARNYNLRPTTNQYFCVSIFNPDENGVARRRKALFLRTRVIVLDDVKEKLSVAACSLLPQPSYILETSPGSEQWGYILTEPCHDRAMVENLLDGLVANGLAPDGRDPGMKGVTRYVRLPDGVNHKVSKFIDGKPWQCRITDWHPERTTTMEALAAPFCVDLHRERREARTDGAISIPDHPLLHIPEIIKIKEIRSDGRFDITCPWVDEHTGGDDSGSAIFTNDDGSIGFHCHHGGCQERTSRDMMRVIETKLPGFSQTMANWRAGRTFASVTETPAPDFMGTPDFMTTPTVDILAPLRRMPHTDPEARTVAAAALRIAEDMPKMEQVHYHKEITDLMQWSKADFKAVLDDLRRGWYDNAAARDFLANLIFIREQNRFYDFGTRIYYTADAFTNGFNDQDAEIRKQALECGKVTKVDRLDFAPRMPRVFTEKGVIFGNSWTADQTLLGAKGDCSWWLAHWDKLGWTQHRDHHLKWMAYTLRFPENKINHMLLFGGKEGIGKDFLTFPVMQAMGEYAKTIDGTELASNHNEYVMNTKLLMINETEMADHAQSREVSNRLKPLAAAPPNTLRVNPKGITAINIRNIVNCMMMTNDRTPLRLGGTSRRFHAAWSDLNIRDEYDNVLPEWREYWKTRWEWMLQQYEACIYHLMNEVDLTGFNPGEAPAMTEFLRDIRESSKSAAAITVETFINQRIGAFKSDLVTVNDLSNTMRAAEMSHSELLNQEASWFTPVRIGRILAEIGCSQKRVSHKGQSLRIWVLRNSEKHTGADVYAMYEVEMARSKIILKLVAQS